ncbi:MAG: WD40 repeat domain-containing protein [Candidatus Saganbacteria bacterium]|nr:WD40 repeat domain-containing protein [Candidatus Saganbacteria bacterium]
MLNLKLIAFETQASWQEPEIPARTNMAEAGERTEMIRFLRQRGLPIAEETLNQMIEEGQLPSLMFAATASVAPVHIFTKENGGHQKPVSSLVWGPDNLLVTGSHDKTAKVFAPLSRSVVLNLDLNSGGHMDTVTSVDISPDGKLLASGSLDKSVIIIPPANPSDQIILDKTNNGHAEFVRTVAFSPNGKLLASNGDDNTVKIFDLSTNRVVQNISVFSPHGNNNTLVWNPCSRRLFVAKGEEVVPLDIRTGELMPLNAIPPKIGRISALARSRVGSLLAMGSEMSRVKVIDLQTDEEVFYAGSRSGHRVNSVAFSPDATLLASAHNRGSIRIVDLRSKETIITLDEKNIGFHWRATAVGWSLDGQLFAMAGTLDAQDTTEIRVFNWQTIYETFVQRD